jgi:predicted Zn finger-like uncharacterized protein
MIVICKECETAFNIDESLIKESGSRARCSKCSHEFTVYPATIGSEPEPEFAVREPDLVSNEQPDTLEGDLGLLDTDPIPFDFEEEDTTAIIIEDADPEPDSGLENAGDFEFSASTEDVEETIESDLPDLEGFDEEYLSEGSLISENESAASDPEGVLEKDEETLATANPDTGMPETDEIDLADLEELINMDDFPGAGEMEESTLGKPQNVLEIEAEDLVGSANTEDQNVGSDVLDISDLEKILDREEDPDAVPADIYEPDDCCGEIESACNDEEEDGGEGIFDIDTLAEEAGMTIDDDDTAEKPAGSTATGSDVELEILLGPDGQILENGPIEGTNMTEGVDPGLFFPESETTNSQNNPIGQISATGDKYFSESRDPGSTSGDVTIKDFEANADLNGKTHEIDQIPVKPLPWIKKSRTRIATLTFFSFLITAAGILVTAKIVGFKIPYLDDAVKNISTADALFSSGRGDTNGNLAITPLEQTVTAKFVENDGAGKLFVVSGQVLNEYDHPRSFIKVSAKLYQKGNKLIKTAEVYCGNVIDEQGLAGMEFSTINRRLQNRFGDRRSNLKVRSGKVVPFMIVFNQLPYDLDEYSVEVAESAG